MKYNYISFDMGSESMAAFCHLKDDLEGFNIDLQEYAEKLLGKGLKGEKIEYLLSEKDGKIVKSSRLRNLISIEDFRQPVILPESHARLDFIKKDGNVIRRNENEVYIQSLFRFFYKKDQDLSRKVIPNPKIPFQEGAGKIIPEIESKEKEKIRYKPETVIHHMMSQVIRNFVLKSSKLRNKQVGKTNTCLILTIPNVYSPSHAQSIEKFIRKYVNIDKVETLYESDAVAYYALGHREIYPEVKEFFSDMRRLSKRKDIEGYQILTIDIGHGTTDLSLIEIAEPQQVDQTGYNVETDNQEHTRFFVKGRTGKVREAAGSITYWLNIITPGWKRFLRDRNLRILKCLLIS